MARPKKAAAKKAWEYQLGGKPNTVTAFERKDKKGVVTLRWWPAGAKRYETKSLGIYLRDADRSLITERVAEAQQKTKDAYNNLIAGLAPGAPAPGAPAANPKVTLTLEEGFALAFATPDGMYDDAKGEHYLEMVRYKKRVLKHLPTHLPWAELVPADYTTLIRKLARDYVAAGVGGRTASLRCGIILAQTARWLGNTKKVIPFGAGLPDPKWETTFMSEWAKITDERDFPDPPAHTEEELGRLHGAAQARKCDPRFRLIFILAAEARLGQASRAQYSWLNLGDIGAHGLGRLTIPDYGKKHGTLIDLTVATRADVDFEMREGYLRDLEAARVRGDIADYPLLPGGRLVAGIAPVTALASLGDRVMNDMFHELELQAGVAIVEGRGWYGVRRVSTDLAEDVEADDRALNRLTGHKSSDTRKIYQRKQREKVAVKVAAARTNLRETAIAQAEAAGAPDAPAGPSKWERGKTGRKERRQDKHKADARKAEETAARIAAGLPVSV